jgi:hypothetical protein
VRFALTESHVNSPEKLGNNNSLCGEKCERVEEHGMPWTKSHAKARSKYLHQHIGVHFNVSQDETLLPHFNPAVGEDARDQTTLQNPHNGNTPQPHPPL